MSTDILQKNYFEWNWYLAKRVWKKYWATPPYAGNVGMVIITKYVIIYKSYYWINDSMLVLDT